MGRFRDEMKVISPAVWAFAAVVYVTLVIVLARLVIPPSDIGPGPAGRLLFIALIPVSLSIYVLLIGYVFHDAKRRGMRHVLWTLLAALVPNAIGIILYFILREPAPLQACSACGAVARSGFAFCPQCGAHLARACSACRRPIEQGWSHCAFCGTKLT